MAHIHDKIDFTVSAYIVCKDKVLLRYHEKYHLWIVPGGHVELDEDPIQALHREVAEEAGLTIKIISDSTKEYPNGVKDLPVPLFINRHRVTPTHEHLDLIYGAVSESMEINPAPEELTTPDHFRWLTAEEIESVDDITLDVKFHALTVLTKVQNQ